MARPDAEVPVARLAGVAVLGTVVVDREVGALDHSKRFADVTSARA